jgi:hypothetical protein
MTALRLVITWVSRLPRVYLADELTAPPAWRHFVQHAAGIAPHCDDLRDPVLTCRDHRSDRRMLRAEACP